MKRVSSHTTSNNINAFNKIVEFNMKSQYTLFPQLDMDRIKIRNALNRVKIDYDLAFKKLAKE